MVTWVIWQLYESSGDVNVGHMHGVQFELSFLDFQPLPVVATFLLRIKTTYGAPHQTINAIQELLKALGYSISSPDNFENSLRCDTCQVTLKFQKSFQAVWLLRRHTREKAHQVKAGWILDDENNVQRSKPKGKLKSSRIKCS